MQQWDRSGDAQSNRSSRGGRALPVLHRLFDATDHDLGGFSFQRLEISTGDGRSKGADDRPLLKLGSNPDAILRVSRHSANLPAH